ncbi:hypothetical protein T06_9259 [Trichinella sp. T6]|nr:hypothetical protein T06_9259 [Trichinella sp. T6]
MNGFICADEKLNEHFVDKMCTDFIKNPFQMKNSSSPNPLTDCWGFFVRFTEHRKVKSLLLAKNATKFSLKNRHFLSCLAKKFNKIDVINLLINLHWEVLGLTSQCSQ